MPTQEFKWDNHKYTPEREGINNGASGRVWNRYELRDHSWRYQGALFIPSGYTKGQIVEAFEEYQN